MRAPFAQFRRIFASHAISIGPRSTVRTLACESLTKRYVLTAAPLVEFVLPEEMLPESVCVPEMVQADSTTSADESLPEHDLHVAAPESLSQQNSAATDAALATLATESSAAMLPEGPSDEFDWLAEELSAQLMPLDPLSPLSAAESLDDSTNMMPPLNYVNVWDSLLPEGEDDDLFMNEAPGEDGLTGPDDEIDPWDDAILNDRATGNIALTSFDVAIITGGYILQGNVQVPDGSPQEIQVHFGGIADGHAATPYADGNFFYYLILPQGMYGSLSAQGVDSLGLTSNTLYGFIYA